MSQLFSKKNKEVFATPLGLNNPVTGTGYRDGSFGNCDYGFLKRRYLFAA